MLLDLDPLLKIYRNSRSSFLTDGPCGQKIEKYYQALLTRPYNPLHIDPRMLQLLNSAAPLPVHFDKQPPFACSKALYKGFPDIFPTTRGGGP